MGLLSLGTLTYAGVNFNGSAMETKSISARPRMDAAGRGRTWTEYTLNLRLFFAALPTDPGVLAARTILTQPGQKLVYADKGYGPLLINIGQSADAIWGPIPKEVGFEPLGGGNACYVDWQVSVAVACSGGAPTGTAAPFIELLYSISTSIDPAGYTTRRISVMGRVPGVRFGNLGGLELTGTADDYRSKVDVPLITGFRRTYPNWNIDQSKTVLTGEIVDEELGINFLPPGVAVGNASHEVSTTGVAGMTHWQATISADFELEKASAIDQFDLARYFISTLCNDRINATATALDAVVGEGAGAIFPISFRMREDEIFGRLKASFSFGYGFTRSFAKIFSACSLWRPVPGSSWTRWIAALQGTQFGRGPATPRGFAQLGIQSSDDSIVDGCGGRLPGIFGSDAILGGPDPSDGGLAWGGGGDWGPNGATLRTDASFFKDVTGKPFFPPPSPGNSWISYEASTYLEVDSGVVPVRPLPTRAPTLPANRSLTGNPFDRSANAVGGQSPNYFNAGSGSLATDMAVVPVAPQVSGDPAVIAAAASMAPQQRLTPLTYVFVRGSGMRYGYPVPIPALVDYCGVKPVLSCRLDNGEGFEHGVDMGGFGTPIYRAKWNLRYLLPGGMAAFFFPPALPNEVLNPPGDSQLSTS